LPHLLEKVNILERYGKDFLYADELTELRKQSEKALIGFLGHSLLRRRDREFRRYQKIGYANMGRKWPRGRILASALNQCLDIVLNPKFAIETLLRKLGKGARRR